MFVDAMSRLPRRRRGLPAALVGVSLLISACGPGTAATPDTPGASAAAEAAAANIDGLQRANNVLDIEVLDVADGSVSTLRSAVDGDRPVLLWFFAPH